MKLKRYLNFITELKENDPTLWSHKILTQDDIRDIGAEFIDNGYELYLYECYYDRYEDVVTELILPGEFYRAYQIDIISDYTSTGEDLTDVLSFFIDYISAEFNLEYKESKKSPSFIRGDTELWFVSLDKFERNNKEFADDNKFSYDYTDGKNVYIDLDIESLANIVVNRNSDYKSILVHNGIDTMYDYYDISYYRTEYNDIFHTLNKENNRLYIECIIKDIGLDKIKKYVKDINKYDEIVDFLLNERFNSTILDIIKKEVSKYDDGPTDHITSMMSNWTYQSHINDNYKEIISEFESGLSDHDISYEKIDKEVDLYYKIGDERKSYKDNITCYRIPFEDFWLKDIDYLDPDYFYHNSSIKELFSEWYYKEHYEGFALKPRLSDYVRIDNKEFNEELKPYLEKYLKD